MNELTPEEALKWLDETLAEFPPRPPQGEITKSMKWMTINIVKEERAAFVGALRIWLQQRKNMPFFPLDLAVHHHLTELKLDLEATANAMENVDGFPAYYKEFVPRFRNELAKL
jgi:hypothetical protein